MTLPKNKNDINGILLLDKPLHLSSNQALQKVKRLFNARKAGHTGSLDPLATGMLPICFGKATKLAQKILESNKSYYVKIKLGEKTKTGDREGEVIATKPIDHILKESIQTILQKFQGEIQQIPPMFSALKYQGKPLYELARQGIEIERQPRTVHIHELTLLNFEKDTADFSVHCSKGTYIRTLAEDIAEALNTCAHVIELRRLNVSPFKENQMIPLATLETIFQEHGFNGLTSQLFSFS